MATNTIVAREETFQMSVIERSHKVPVLVDFWAPWCGPCRTLTPVLEELAAAGEGRWLLAKVNTDENQALAAQYGVRGIPNVKLFKDGKIVDEFVGAQPRPVVERFLQRWIVSAQDKQVAEAEAQIEQGEFVAARASLETLLSEQADHPKARRALARLELEEGNAAAALTHLEHLPERGPEAALTEQLRARARLAAAPQESADDLGIRLDAEPENLDLRFERAMGAARTGDYDTAVQDLMTIIETDRRFREGAAHKAMLDLFALMGDDDPRTVQYRQQLSWLLFS